MSFNTTTIPLLPPSTQGNMSTVSFVLLLLSAFLVIPVCLANGCLQQRRKGPSIYTSLFLSSSLLFSCTMLVTNRRVATLLHYNVSDMTHPQCWVQGIAVQFSATSMTTSWLIVAHVLYQIVVKDQKTKQIMSNKCYLMIVWWLIPSTILTVVPFLIKKPVWQTNLDFCWLNEDATYQLLSFHIWMFLIALLGARKIVPVLQKLRNYCRSGSTNITIRDYIVRHTMFILSFVLVFVLVCQYAVTLWFVRRYPMSKNSKWFLVAHQGWYAISAQIMNVAYSSIGILGFLVFGTAHQLLKKVCFCCFNRNTLSPSFSEPLRVVNGSMGEEELEEEEDPEYAVVSYCHLNDYYE